MNRSIIVTILITLVLGATAGYIVGGSKTHPTDNSNTSTQSTSMPGMIMSGADELKDKSGDTLDAAFLDSMLEHHQQAIDMANAVLTRTKRPEVKQLAQNIIDDQTKEVETIKGMLRQSFGR